MASSTTSTTSIPTSSSSSTDTTSSANTTSTDLSSSSSAISSSSSTFTSSSASSTTTSSTTSSSALVTTSTTFSPTSIPATTIVSTSIVTQTQPSSSVAPHTVVVTSIRSATTSSVAIPVTTTLSSTSSSPTLLTPTSSNDGHSTGLSKGGTIAIAVVVPVVVVALLLGLGIFCWRKRQQRKDAAEARRKEVEDYGFNPNHDPTLPAVASEAGGLAMSEDTSGYRGWGATNMSSRKLSTTLSGGQTQGQRSDTGLNHYPTNSVPVDGFVEGHNGDALDPNRRETMTSDDLGALGGAAAGGQQLSHGNNPRRGPSNASSSYSHGNHSDVSDDRNHAAAPAIGQAYDYPAAGGGLGYSQHGPYGDGTYGGGEAGMPVVQDVSARRNTRIQQPGNYQQGNSGIAQNF